MTLELACELAIAIGLLTHSALLVRQSWYLASWFKAIDKHEVELYRLVHLLQGRRPDDAAPDARAGAVDDRE